MWVGASLLIGISLIIRNVEHLSMCLMAIETKRKKEKEKEKKKRNHGRSVTNLYIFLSLSVCNYAITQTLIFNMTKSCYLPNKISCWISDWGRHPKICISKLKLASHRIFLLPQMVKKLSATQETWVQSWEDLLEKGITTHSSFLALRIPCTEELGGLYSPWGCKESGIAERLTLSQRT